MEVQLFDTDLIKNVKKIAEVFDGIEYKVVCDEAIFQIPSEIGFGTIRGINFEYGLGLLNIHCIFEEKFTLDFLFKKRHPLRFLSIFEGEFTHSLPEADLRYQVTPSSCAICSSTEDVNQSISFPPKTDIIFTMLEIDRLEFFEKIKCDLDTVPKEFAEALTDIKACEPYFYLGNYGILLAKTLRDIDQNPYTELARKAFLEAKAIEIFSTHLQQFRHERDPYSDKMVLGEYDLKQILKAKEILLEDLSRNITIKELANEVGLSESKLKRGFKTVVGETIGKFVRIEKLNAARYLLLSGTKNVKEVANLVGYGNNGHFSKRFKEQFGVYPKEVLKFGANELHYENAEHQ